VIVLPYSTFCRVLLQTVLSRITSQMARKHGWKSHFNIEVVRSRIRSRAAGRSCGPIKLAAQSKDKPAASCDKSRPSQRHSAWLALGLCWPSCSSPAFAFPSKQQVVVLTDSPPSTVTAHVAESVLNHLDSSNRQTPPDNSCASKRRDSSDDKFSPRTYQDTWFRIPSTKQIELASQRAVNNHTATVQGHNALESRSCGVESRKHRNLGPLKVAHARVLSRYSSKPERIWTMNRYYP
jgi:hypothetical protein